VREHETIMSPAQGASRETENRAWALATVAMAATATSVSGELWKNLNIN
jgi:hypothetical protein